MQIAISEHLVLVLVIERLSLDNKCGWRLGKYKKRDQRL